MIAIADVFHDIDIRLGAMLLLLGGGIVQPYVYFCLDHNNNTLIVIHQPVVPTINVPRSVIRSMAGCSPALFVLHEANATMQNRLSHRTGGSC